MRRVVIFFPSEWVAYSPTILNLVEVLRLSIPVRVIAIDNGKYDNTRLDPGVFHLIKVPDWLFRGTAVVWAYRRLKYWLLTKSITPEVSDIVIGVDNLGVLCAQAVYNYVHFLSLEIERDRLFQCIDWTRVLSLAIQSEVRLRYLFPKDAPAPVFLLPNAPILRSPPAAEAASHGRQLILLGNLTPAHGVFQCIDAVAGMEAATLTLKGPMRVSMRRAIESRYPKLLNDKRLIMDTTYVPQEDMVEYLKQFDVGFCFYDFNILKKGDFNYLSSPSGKLYNYFAAGVPVIGSDIPGLADAVRFDAGVLLPELSPVAIREAISVVLTNRARFRAGCRSAAITMDFGRHAAPYRSYLLESPVPTC